MDYQGTIIEESLNDSSILKDLTVLSTRVEPVTDRHKTPWLKQWTLHKVMVRENQAEKIAETISHLLDYGHKNAWYADYKNKKWHYIIFKNKIFQVARNDGRQYRKAKQYGINLGIPPYQVDFSPDIK